MRFSLKSFLLLTATWPVAFAFSNCLPTSLMREVSCTECAVTYAVPAVESIDRTVTHFTPTASLVNRQKLKALLLSGVESDSWGRTLVTVDSRKSGGSLGVYSVGLDGISKSCGNDPDDVNSWDRHHTRYYAKKCLRNRIPCSIWLTPFAAIVIFFSWNALSEIRTRSG